MKYKLEGDLKILNFDNQKDMSLAEWLTNRPIDYEKQLVLTEFFWSKMAFPLFEVDILDPLDAREVAELKRINHGFTEMASFVAYHKLLKLLRTLKHNYKHTCDINTVTPS